MKLRVYDVFDPQFTCVIWEEVDWVDNGTVYFKDGTEATYNPRYEDWEEI